MTDLNQEIADLLGDSQPRWYDSDPAAALDLLDFVADMGEFTAFEISRDSDGATVRTVKLGERWTVIKGVCHQTDKRRARCESIAIACRDALLAVRADQ
jgi:hypothetical protein